MNEDLSLITSTIDDSLNYVGNNLNGLISTIYNVPDYMVDPTKQTNTNDWCHWKPLKADVSNSDIESYEKNTGIKLPASYRTFLGYKFFIDLNFGHEVTFFKHTKSWISDNLELINQWGIEFTTERGLLPFADYSDWGLVCFDANGSFDDNEYNIVYLDHEDLDTPKEYVHGRFAFIDLIKEMNQRLKEWKQEKLNGG